MTIGIGFQSQDGVVLCADRQMTVQGNFKYPERKIKAHFDGFSSFIFTYAGFPEPAEAMFDKLGDNLEEQYKKARGRSPIDKTKAAVQKIFDDKRAKGLYVLLGVSIGNLGQPFLLKISERVVTRVLIDFIGIGDSSALRYLCGFLLKNSLTVWEYQTLGSYIVSVANRYVDGCSGGPDHAILLRQVGDDKKLRLDFIDGTGGPYPNAEHRFLHCEEQIGEKLRNLLLSGGHKDS